jgi:hypothetical protein
MGAPRRGQGGSPEPPSITVRNQDLPVLVFVSLIFSPIGQISTLDLLFFK